MERGKQVRSSSSLAHISQKGSLKGAGKCGDIKADGVIKYKGLSQSCATKDGVVIVEDSRVIWSQGIFATGTEGIGLTI
jgi:hypothetical protein